MPYQQEDSENHFGSADESTKIIASTKRGNFLPFLVVAVSTIAAIFLFTTTGISPSIKTSSLLSNPKKALFDDSGDLWTVYKLTTSVKPSTYTEVQSMVDSYLCESSYTNLGCNETNKVACNVLDLFGIHWIDSTSFYDLAGDGERAVGEWTDYVASLGTTDYNPFMHNKVMLFVPDLSAHYSLFAADGITTMKRLSMSSGSSEYDVGHMTLFMEYSATAYEIIGPASTLTADALSEFSAWEEKSCASSHALPNSLEYYVERFASIAATNLTTWEESTGLRIPMGVMIQVPMSSVSAVSDTLDLVSSMTTKDVNYSTVTTGSSSCTVAEIQVNAITVRYVANDADFSSTEGYSLTVADWEADIVTANEMYVDTDNTIYSWNRYLDSHIGIYIPDASESCDYYYDYIEDQITANAGDFDYALRVATTFGVGTHYYTAVDGIRSWEFNADLCAQSNQTDICGCMPDNSKIDFFEVTGITHCGQYSI